MERTASTFLGLKKLPLSIGINNQLQLRYLKEFADVLLSDYSVGKKICDVSDSEFKLIYPEIVGPINAKKKLTLLKFLVNHLPLTLSFQLTFSAILLNLVK